MRLEMNNDQKREKYQEAGYDDFCQAHQIPYNKECPDCALLVVDRRANEAWKADECHTGDAPDTYVQGFRAAYLISLDDVPDDPKDLQMLLTAARQGRRNVIAEASSYRSALTRVASVLQDGGNDPFIAGILKTINAALKKI